MHDIGKIGALAVLVVAGNVSGCGTIFSRKEATVVDSPLYSGTRWDGLVILVAAAAPFANNEGSIAFLLLPFALIDLPLSLAADTLLLPITISEHFGSERKTAKALVAAIESGDLAEVQALVGEDPGLLRLDLAGGGPLSLAVRQGQPELVDWLASSSASAGEEEELDDALMVAVEKGRPDLVRILLDRGAQLEGGDQSGQPMSEAVMRDDSAVIALLLDRGASLTRPPGTDTPLHRAASGGNAETAELLIARGADVNASGWKGNTPLHVAAWRGHMAVALVLVNRGADVGLRNEEGKTPLELAASRGHAEVAVFLGSRGGGR